MSLLTLFSGSSPTHSVKLGSWQWYSDATDASMSPLAGASVAPTLTGTQMQNQIIRLRLQLDEIGGVAGSGTVSIQYREGSAAAWRTLEAQTPTSNQEGVWFRYANGAGTANATLTSNKLTGTTASGTYIEADAPTVSVGANSKTEVDIAVYVHWPPPDSTIQFQVLYAGTALTLDTGSSNISLTTSTAANRPYTVTRLDGDLSQKTTREVRFSPWRRLFYDSVGQNWWLFTVQYNTPTILRSYYWNGSGAWIAGATFTSANNIYQTRHALVATQTGTGLTVYSHLGSSATTRHAVRGTISGTTLTWGSATSITQATDRHTHVALDDNGFVWIGGTTAATGIWVNRATATDSVATFGTASTAADTQVISGDVFTIIGIGTNKIMAIWRPTGTGATALKYCTIDSTGTVSAVGNVNTTTTTGPEDWGVVRDGNLVYLVHSDASGAGGNWVLRVYDIAAGTWSTGTTPAVSGQVTSNDGIALAKDASGNIYAFGTDNGTGGQDRINFYKKYTGGTTGTWDASRTNISPSGRGNSDHISVSESPGANNLMLLSAWGDDDIVGNARAIEYFTVPTVTITPVSASDSGSVSVTDTSGGIVNVLSVSTSDSSNISVVESPRTLDETSSGSSGAVTRVQETSGTSASGTTTTTATFATGATAGNIIWAAGGFDKNVTAVTPVLSGWNVVFEQYSSSVSSWFAWRVATGGETAITVNHGAATAGSTLWIGEYSQAGTGAWEIKGSATNPTNETTVSSTSTGTTAVTSSDGAGIAMAAIDSGQSATSGTEAFSNSYVIQKRFAASGRGDVAVGENISVPAGTAATSTFSYTGTADQVAAAIAVFGRVPSVAVDNVFAYADDSASVSVSGTASIGQGSTPISGSESPSVSVTETTAVFKDISTSDSVLVSVTDISNVSSTLPGNESVSVSVTESSLVVVTQSTADSGSVSVTDNSSVFVTVSATESVQVSVTDVSAPFKQLTATESPLVSVTDVSAVVNSFSSTDPTNVSVTDISSGSVVFSTTDAVSVSVTEVSTVSSSLPGTEPVSVSVSEASAVFVTSSASETNSVSVTDSSIVASTIASSETNSISVTDASSVSVSISTNDPVSVSVTDASAAFKSISATDSTNVSITDVSNVLTSSSVSDSVQVSVTDNSAVFKDISTSESVSVSVTETSNVASTLPGTESASVSISESSSVFVTSSANDLLTVVGAEASAVDTSSITTDSTNVSVQDISSIFVITNTTDSGSISVTETSDQVKTVTASDSINVSVTEVTDVYKQLTAFDSTNVSVTDIAGISGTMPGTENTSVSVTDQSSVLVITNANDSGSASVTETAGTTGVNTISAIDSGSVSVTDTSSRSISTAANDSTNVSIAEARTITVTFTTNDPVSVSVTDTSSVFKNITTQDSTNVSVTEVANSGQLNNLAGNESGTIGVSEQSSVLKVSSANDSSQISVTDASATRVSVSAQDAGIVSVSDTTSGDVTAIASDAGSLSIIEQSYITKMMTAFDATDLAVDEAALQIVSDTREASDTLSISVDDQGEVKVDRNIRNIVATDDLTIVSHDYSSRWVFGETHEPISFDSNSTHGTITDVSDSHGVNITSSDSSDTSITGGGERKVSYE